ncbi:hypothetical protein [Streptomyces sp. NBC_00470]|uniref:hypothetical protein n=1 Tax=Streptomyces sp. NBC_00470 TaxID=2975753 RepID=UPI002F90DBDA
MNDPTTPAEPQTPEPTREQKVRALNDGYRQGWEVTLYEEDDDGNPVTDDPDRAHILEFSSLPTTGARVVARTAFAMLQQDPAVPDLHPTEYDARPTKLIPPTRTLLQAYRPQP